MSIWRWIDGDNGRFRAWAFGAFCGAVLGVVVSMTLIVFPIFENRMTPHNNNSEERV